MNRNKIIIIGATLFLLGGVLFLNQTQAVNYLASDLLGQVDGSGNPVYTSSTSGATDRRIYFATQPAIDPVNHRLFVADCLNNRVLVFNLDSNNDLLDRVADNVIGQSTFTASSSATSQSGLNNPCGVSYDSVQNRLFVGDRSNNRILIFDVSSITDGEAAIGVLGQPNFTFSNATSSQTGLSGPGIAAFNPTNNLLYVADEGNRIIIFDVATTTNGEAAIGVLGQSDFTSYSPNTSQTGLYEATTGALDSATDRLFLADKKNNRILVFDVATTTNGEAAIGVLGQSDFVTNTTSTSQTKIIEPQGMTLNTSTNMLYVSSAAENRILVFDVATTTNGEAAVNVIGQPNFTSTTAATTQDGFNEPLGLLIDPGRNRLYIGDSLNNRVVILDFVRIGNTSFANGVVGTSYGPTISVLNNQGTTTISVSSGSVPTGLSSLLSGTPTAAGTYSFTLRATDAFPSGNILFDKAYTITIAPEGTPAVSVSVPTFTFPQGGGGGVSSNAIQSIKSIQEATEDLASSTKSMEETMKSRTPEERTVYVQATQIKLVSLLVQLLSLLQQLLAARSAL